MVTRRQLPAWRPCPPPRPRPGHRRRQDASEIQSVRRPSATNPVCAIDADHVGPAAAAQAKHQTPAPQANHDQLWLSDIGAKPQATGWCRGAGCSCRLPAGSIATGSSPAPPRPSPAGVLPPITGGFHWRDHLARGWRVLPGAAADTRRTPLWRCCMDEAPRSSARRAPAE
jgi:hypothetical protein